jgi:hypothetical protein
MSYQVNKTNGAILVEIPDQTINTTATSLALIGRAAVNYGEKHAENFVHLLENFANVTAPANPIAGQIWFDTTAKQAKVYDGALWKALGSATTVSGSTSAGGTTLGGITSGADRTAGAVGLLVSNGIAGSTVTLIFAEGKIISVIAEEIIGAASLPATVTIENVNYALAARFPNGLRKGFTLATGDYVFGGTATSSNYADVAERYATSEPVEAGDIVEIGGSAEIRKVRGRASDAVFGIISEKPGVRLNEDAGDDASHPFVALAGRVFCKVKGPVAKGARLMSSGIDGIAEAADAGVSPFAVVGRALHDKSSEDVGLLEVVVGRF